MSNLVTDGPNALAAEPLARKLGTTKGSFYWHFKDVPDFQSRVIKHWQSIAFARIMRALEDNGSAEQRLRRFGKDTLSNSVESAVRAWARTDKSVAKAVAQVDAERLKYIFSLLRHMGVSNEDFARNCLASLVGLPSVATERQARKAFEVNVDMILALK